MENLTQNQNPSKTSSEQLKFKKRQGTTDKGREYEDSVIAYVMLKLLLDEKVENFKLSSNDGEYGAFDDVVVEVERTNGAEHKYAIQLKHKKQRDVTASLLAQAEKNSDFSLLKYFKSFRQNREKFFDFKLVLWTNSKLKCDNVLTVCDPDDKAEFQVKVVECQLLYLPRDPHGNCFKFEIVPNESLSPEKKKQYEDFFDAFFLYTKQLNVDALKVTEIPNNISKLTNDKNFKDKYLKFISEWNQKDGTKDKLTKAMMRKVIALILLNDSVHPHLSGEATEGAKLFQKAIWRFDVAVFKNKSLNSVRKIWSDCKDILRGYDIKSINDVRKQYQISEKYFEDVDHLTEEHCTKLSWIMNLCPLIIENTPNALEALDICGRSGKFILITEDPQSDLGQRSVFRKLTDSKQHQRLYEEIATKIRFSLLGDAVNLRQLIDLDKNFEEIITTDTLLSLTNNSDILEQKEENLLLYIERYLYKTMIRMDYVNRVDETTLILISNIERQKAKFLFRNFEIVHIKDKKENIKGRKIYINGSNTSQEEFSELCKTNGDYSNHHHFRFSGYDRLEWIESLNGVSELQEFCVKNEQLPEEEIEENTRNKINIIVGDAGMGKTSFLRKLKNRLISKNLVKFMSAKEAYDLFKDSKKLTEVYDVIFESNDFEKLLSKNGKLVLLWDALDEVSERERVTIEDLILDLSKNGVTNFVTSRPHIKSKLENKFGVLAKEICLFDIKQQTDYMRKSVENLEQDVTEMINKLPKIFGNPLYIFLLTEIYREDPNKYQELFTENLCVTDLYHRFIDRQMGLYFKEKCNFLSDHHQSREQLEENKSDRRDKYEVIALKLLFGEGFLSKLQLTKSDKFLKKISKDGDPVGLINNVREQERQAEFIHISYAEYFAALYLFENCEDIKNLSEVIFERKHSNIRFFFDMLSARESPEHIAILNKNINCLENDKVSLSSLDSLGRSLLQIAASWCERNPLLEVTQRGDLDDKSYSFNEKTDYVTDSQAETDQRIVGLLLERCDLEHEDSLFEFTATEYAERCECFLTAAVIEKRRGTDYLKTKGPEFVCSLLYYSARCGVTDVLDMLDDVDFIHDTKNDSLLHIAVRNDRPEFVSRLLSFEKYKQNIDFWNSYGETALNEAARNGKENLVRLLVENEAYVNARDLNYVTPLFWAAQRGDLDVARFLVEKGADFNAADHNGVTILHCAARNGNLEVAKFLVENGASVNVTTYFGETILRGAIRKGHLDVAEFLLENGADINGTAEDCETALDLAARNDHLDGEEFPVESWIDVSPIDNNGETILHWAAKNGNLDAAKFLLENGADVNVTTCSDETVLLGAVRNGHLDFARFLVENGADVNATTDNGETILHWAVASGLVNLAKLLVEEEDDVSATDNNEETIPHWAAKNGNLDVVEFLVEKGADVTAAANNGETILHWAAKNGNLDVAKFLVEKGADVGATANNGETTLHWAARDGNLDVAKLLLEKGADVNAAADNGETILHWAVQDGNLEVAKFLVEKGADVTATDNNGETILNLAVRNKRIKIVKFLLEIRADISATDNNGETLLRWAAQKGHLNVMKLLVENGARVSATANNGGTILHCAVQNGHLNVAKFLVGEGANVNATAVNGGTILHWAAQKGRLDFATFLVENGADVSARDDHGKTILLCATQNGHLDVTKFLVENGANTNATGNNGETILHWAALKGHLDLAKFLVEKGADVSATSTGGETILHYAILFGHLDFAKFLLENGADINATTNDGETILHWATSNDHLNIIKLLEEDGDDVSATATNEETIPHWAAISGNLDVAKFLVENGADVSATAKNGETVLHWAARNCNLEFAKFLVENGADLSATANNGETILHWAATNGNLDVAKFLLENKADVAATTNNGETILHWAARQCNLEFAKFLVENGADVGATTNNGETVLHWAENNGNLRVAKFLIENGADVSAITNFSGIVRWAVRNGHLDFAKLLVKGARVGARAYHSGRILHWAAQKGHLEFAKFLVENGADTNATAYDGKTILHWAVQNCHLDFAQLLLENGADVNAKHKNGGTVLHWAARKGDLNMTRFLVERGADVNARHKNGGTVLHSVERNDDLNIVKFLVEKGADVNAKANDGVTILHAAAVIGHLDFAKFLVEEGADFTATDDYGQSILHWAAFNGHLNIAKFLVEKGVEVNATDNDGETILHRAGQKGHLDFARFLVKNGADVNMATNDGQTPLHWAVKHGYLDFAKFLVKNGADVNVTDKDGETPLHLAEQNGHRNVAKFLGDNGAEDGEMVPSMDRSGYEL